MGVPTLRKNKYRYTGTLIKGTTDLANAEIEAGFDIRDAHFHDHVELVLDELVHNAMIHSPPKKKQASVALEQDEQGTYVNVVSIARVKDAQYVERLVCDNIDSPDEDLLNLEIETFKENSGTGRGGVGLYQIMRSVVRRNGRRLIFVNFEPYNDGPYVELSLKAYVSKDTSIQNGQRRN